MKSHLPALLLAIPLFAAATMPMVSIRRPAWCRLLTILVTALMTVTAIINVALVIAYGETRYDFSGWAAPLGIEWVADALSSVVMVAVSAIACVCLVYEGEVRLTAERGRVTLHYVLILLLLSGLTGVVFAADLFNVFVFLETATLTTCALVAMADGKALVFAFRYLMLASIGATFYLLGVSFVYAVTGTLNMADLAAQLPALAGSSVVTVGVVFMFLGLAIKMALMPFHGWLPDAYTSAPDAVAPLLSSLVTKVSLFAWVRIMYWVVGAGQDTELGRVMAICWMLGAVATVVGASLALIQRDVKRMFAYGGVSHIGLIMLGAGIGNQTGLVGAVFYLITDAVMQATLFIVAGVAASHYGIATVDQLATLRRRAPWLLGALVVVGLSMIGIPPTGGFFGKWYMVLGAMQAAEYAAIAAVIMATLLTLAYFGGVWMLAFGREPAEVPEAGPAMPMTLRVCVGAMCVAIVTLGLFSDAIISVLLQATESLNFRPV
jgi:multicomponent Na+:H+ antiporter subunit D